MSRIARSLQKILGLSSGTDEVAQFGSLAAGSPVYTLDVEDLQALSNYDSGWYAAVLARNAPAIQDLNALSYVITSQLAYLFQAGVAEWNTDTTYYIGSLVQDGTGILYKSLTDTNLGNALTDTSKWGSPVQNGVVTKNSPDNFIVKSGDTIFWPNLTIPAAKTGTVDTGAYFLGTPSVVVNGTFLINGSARIF